MRFNITLRQLHAYVLEADSPHALVKPLGSNYETVSLLLIVLCGSFDGKRSCKIDAFNKMKNMTVAEAEAEWGEKYRQKIEVTLPAVADRLTPEKIYTSIVEHDSIAAAAISLGMYRTRLFRVIKFLLDDENFKNHTTWLNLTKKDVRTIFGDAYDKPISYLGYREIQSSCLFMRRNILGGKNSTASSFSLK